MRLSVLHEEDDPRLAAFTQSSSNYGSPIEDFRKTCSKLGIISDIHYSNVGYDDMPKDDLDAATIRTVGADEFTPYYVCFYGPEQYKRPTDDQTQMKEMLFWIRVEYPRDERHPNVTFLHSPAYHAMRRYHEGKMAIVGHDMLINLLGKIQETGTFDAGLHATKVLHAWQKNAGARQPQPPHS